MTVRELIEELQRLPQDVLVLIEAEAPEAGWVDFNLAQRSVWPREPIGYWDAAYVDRDPIWQQGGPREPFMPAVVLDRHVDL